MAEARGQPLRALRVAVAVAVCTAIVGIAALATQGGGEGEVSLLGLASAPADSSSFPSWASGGALKYYDRSEAHGQWSPEAGPPYVKHITMWSDPRCVDHAGPANNVRRILGLKTSWHDHKWNTNSFMSEMTSVQRRSLWRRYPMS
ncbi:hypothetical protein T484DRAFT_3105053 [Baffinella frigidus]|nr:hypothetical protein T484DRAFT_3105053 [Cryptophyta sp. CCMP2293]